jgi:PIF1-like helicase
MTHKHVYDAVDRTLQDIMQTDKRMGGITTLLGGDFRQCLPVVPGASRGQLVRSSIKKAKLWRHVKVLKLVQNMRVLAGGQNHIDFLMDVGNGILSSPAVPQDLKETSLKKLIDFVYPNIGSTQTDSVILTTKNKTVDMINDSVLEKLNGQVR